MANVVSTSGESFHLWALPTDSAREISPSLEFNEIRNDLGNGYRTQVLYGSDTGTRSWSVSLPTLAGIDTPVPTVTGVNGETVSREQYVWDLYNETRITGKPFVFTCPRDGQYYLVDFVNKRLRFDKQFRQKLYSTGIELMQVREEGVSVLVMEAMEVMLTPNFTAYNENGHNAPGAGSWNSQLSNVYLSSTGTVTLAANPQNGFNTARLDGSTGYLSSSSGFNPITDLIVAMKMRETTFSNNGGILSQGSTQFLRGTSAGTKWQDPSHTGLEYRLNGVQYATTDMQAPMNTWGIVHFRAPASNPLLTGSIKIGVSGTTGGTYLKADIGEIIIGTGIPMSVARQTVEHLSIKWR